MSTVEDLRRIRRLFPSIALRPVGVLATLLVAVGLTTFVHGDNGHNSAPAGATAAPAPVPAFQDDLLSIEDRVRYQRRIEQVYWQHRIWPAENPGPKPELQAVVSDDLLRERVATYLQKSAALESLWSRPLTGEQLQAELNRVVRNTRNPELLRELFAALDNDPYLVAECLARPALVNRLTLNRYARDGRFHGALRAQAEAALAARPNEAVWMPELGGEYSEVEWRLDSEKTEIARLDAERAEHLVIDLDETEWRERVARLAELLSTHADPAANHDPTMSLDSLPSGRPSKLIEENDRFTVTAVLTKESDRLRVATVAWNKVPFDEWWSKDGRSTVREVRRITPVLPPTGGYELRQPRQDGCTPDTWTTTWNLPIGRGQHVSVWTGSEMIVWGGTSALGMLNSGGRYDPATETWMPTSTGSGVPTPRVDSTAVWTGTEMIVWGGDEGRESTNTGGRYDPATDSWTATSTGTGAPTARLDYTTVWTGTEMIVWGGGEGTGVTNTGGRYDPVTDGWTATSTGAGAPTGRRFHTAVWAGSKMVVWGGDNGGPLNTGGRYDPVSDSWTATSTGIDVPQARMEHTAVWNNYEMIVWGGYNGDNVYWRTGGRYDLETDSWRATPTNGDCPTGRKYHTAVLVGLEMIIWGGHGVLDTGARYHPWLDRWTATSIDNSVASGRTHHTAVGTGSEMIVWGGNSGHLYLNFGAKYDPGTDAWTATSVGAGVPEGRTSHSMVWTGAEMIVWGGISSLGLNNGGRYNPALDDWAPTSVGDGVPTARSGHEAVWTGLEMILWSGIEIVYPCTRTGARYNPSTDVWTATSTGDGVPEGRRGHTALWTGTEMIVWGGQDGWPVNTGGRYFPETDTWKPTSTGIGVPAIRAGHSAAWTGTEMIVWGGSTDGCVCFDTGGRYDPVSDDWATTSVGPGVPAGRAGHVAVWTGSEMIVWGGAVNLLPLNTGGRYDPIRDDWVATSTSDGVPRERALLTAVWTGREMIVWGGEVLETGIYLETGGRYDPVLDSWTATSTSAGVPTKRIAHTAVWTGSEMLIWGGWDGGGNTGHGTTNGLPNGVGSYCACEGGTVNTWYPDADGDGHGIDSTGVPSCSQPPGYVASGGDCDDRNSGIFPGAAEINDGLDNQCPGDAGHWLVDEIGGTSGFHDAANRNEFSWTAQAGATAYEVARSTDRRFVADCFVHATTATDWDDGTPVPPDSCFHYLVRSVLPNTGSWGANSKGVERTTVCP